MSIPLLFLIPPFLESNNLPVPSDVLVFVFIVVQKRLITSTHQGLNVPNILNTVTRDAEVYFAMISTSHLLIVVMFSVARVGFVVPVFEFNTC